MNQPQDTKGSDELTLEQRIKFNILIPFYSAMEKARQEDIARDDLTMLSRHEIYNEAVALITSQVEQAVRGARTDELNRLGTGDGIIWSGNISVNDRLAELRGNNGR